MVVILKKKEVFAAQFTVNGKYLLNLNDFINLFS